MFEAHVSNIISSLCLKTKSQVYSAHHNLGAWEAAAGSLCVGSLLVSYLVRPCLRKKKIHIKSSAIFISESLL